MARVARAIEPRDYRERYEMQERALAAAYLAYQRSGAKPDEALSLRTLADVFESREMWRPALTAWRLSLEAQDNAEARKSYEELREKRGFRITDNKTDADSATPRACFTFSEPLARGRVDFAPMSRSPARAPTRRSPPRIRSSASRACAMASATASSCARACLPQFPARRS